MASLLQPTELVSGDIYKSDPLARFLIESLHLTPRTFAGVMLLSAIVVLIAVPVVVVALMPKSYGQDGWYRYLLFFTESGYLVFNVILYPVLGGFYLWLSRAPNRLFSELKTTGVLQFDNQQELKIAEQLRSIYFGHHWFHKAVFLEVAIVAAWYFPAFQLRLPRFDLHDKAQDLLTGFNGQIDIGILAALPIILLTLYMLIMIVLRGSQSIWGLSLAFRSGHLAVRPLHPDKCGGLRPLNDYAITCSYLIAVCGFGIGLLSLASHFRGSLFKDYWLFTMIVLYVIIAPLFYFLTLGTAHGVMKANKDQYLDTISKRYQQIHSQVNRIIENGSSEAQPQRLKELLDELEHLEMFYGKTDRFPVWPFDTTSLRRFVSAVSVSVLPAGISVAFKIAEFFH